MFLAFPEFNIYSTPLLFLSLQGLVFVFLLFRRYLQTRYLPDILLVCILLLTCYGQTCYTVGFMGWYDTFRNTKINYALFNIGLGLAPLIYLYVKSITRSSFRLRIKDFLHFLPLILFVLYRIGIYTYDALQPDFVFVQNGELKLLVDEVFVLPMMSYFGYAQMLLYLAFTFQMFIQYRTKLQAYFSNTYDLELNWIRNFLLLYTFLFCYDITQSIVQNFFVDLHYTQMWWLVFCSGLTILYVAIKGYFTDTSKLNQLKFDFIPEQVASETRESTLSKTISEQEIEMVKTLMMKKKPYLNPELNLVELAKLAEMSRGQLSGIINSGFGKNFNDFVNLYRIEAFKDKVGDAAHEKLSLLGIAYECGFNSKATFNRVFKKLTNSSPTEYLKAAI
ncbi:MAG: helix-turn-helix domain-containing protein [Bacteroidota bacterium]